MGRIGSLVNEHWARRTLNWLVLASSCPWDYDCLLQIAYLPVESRTSHQSEDKSGCTWQVGSASYYIWYIVFIYPLSELSWLLELGICLHKAINTWFFIATRWRSDNHRASSASWAWWIRLRNESWVDNTLKLARTGSTYIKYGIDRTLVDSHD